MSVMPSSLTASSMMHLVFIALKLIQTLPSGAFTVGKITEAQRFDVVRHSCPGTRWSHSLQGALIDISVLGPGGCGGMFTSVYC